MSSYSESIESVIEEPSDSFSQGSENGEEEDIESFETCENITDDESEAKPQKNNSEVKNVKNTPKSDSDEEVSDQVVSEDESEIEKYNQINKHLTGLKSKGEKKADTELD